MKKGTVAYPGKYNYNDRIRSSYEGESSMKRLLFCLAAMLAVIFMAGVCSADTLDFDPVEPVEWAVTIDGQQGFDNCETLSEGVFYQMFRDTAVDGWRKFIPEKTGTYHFYVRQPSADNGNWYTAGRFSIQICDQYGTPISGWRVEGNYNNVRVPEVYRYDLEAGRTYYFVATNQYGHWVRTDAYFAICSPTRHIGGLSDEVVIQEPTCTEPGYKAQRCLLCGGETNITEIPAMGHTPGEQVTIKAASPDEADETYTRCVVCGEFLTDEAGNAPDAGESANP